MPVVEFAAPGLFTESVCRVRKLTSFSIVCCTCCGDTSWMTWTILSSLLLLSAAGLAEVPFWEAPRVEAFFCVVLLLCEDGGALWATVSNGRSIRSAIDTDDTLVSWRGINNHLIEELDGNPERF